MIRAFYDQTRCTEMDACTTVDGHVISALWNGSKSMGTLVVGPRGASTRLLAHALDGERALRQTAKRLLKR